jgi:hypothetical protein
LRSARAIERPLRLWRVARDDETAAHAGLFHHGLEIGFEFGTSMIRRAEKCGIGSKPSSRTATVAAMRAWASSPGRW